MTHRKVHVGLLCALSAGGLGSVALGGESPTKLEPSIAKIQPGAHIYYNLVSGERVVTLLGEGQSVGADVGESQPIWSSQDNAPCDSHGFSTAFFFGLDDNSGSSALATNATMHDWGDIALDSVVDCVRINWVSDHNDTDTDSDGLGDGVEGLAGRWSFWDVTDGTLVDVSCLRLPLISFVFTDLPGDTSGTTDSNDPNNVMTDYSADIDLGANFSSSMSFEIGDSDGDLQGADFGHSDVDSNGPIGSVVHDRDMNGLPDNDLDMDGYFDWGWDVRFYQPGTADLDGDGVIDGDFADSMKQIGINFGSPPGEALDHGDGTWSWVIDESIPNAGHGAEDLFALIDEEGTLAGRFWFGGFSCTGNGNGQYTPRADFAIELLGPGRDECIGDVPCSAADLVRPYCQIDFFDVSAFLGAYNVEHEDADLAPPFGVWNFYDISEYFNALSDGCP